MKLYNLAATNMVGSINTAIGGTGYIQFYTNTTAMTQTTGMITGSGLAMHTTAIGTFTTSADPTGTAFTGVFNTIASATVANSGTVAYFGIWTNAGTATTDIILTGTVLTQTADITFNTTSWDVGDNIQITSLTFVQPK